MKFINKYLGIIITIIVIINGIYIFNVIKNKKEVEIDEVILKEDVVDKKETFAIMLQNDDGEYISSNSRVFPTEGYKYNETKSGCMDNNGYKIDNSLSYNNETNKVVVRINKEAHCYVYFDKLYTVTFNPEGGTFSETPPIKEVVYGQVYGDLPEPTREGYTFKGWNGKNKFNKEEFMFLSSYYYSTNYYDWADLYLEPNIKYKMSLIRYNGYDGKTTVNGQDVTIIIGYSRTPNTDSQWSSIAHDTYPNVSHTNYLYTAPSDKPLYIGCFRCNQDKLDIVWQNTDLQLEEGTVATEYEPYYIESDTKVVQRQNHTLKAIWEENS